MEENNALFEYTAKNGERYQIKYSDVEFIGEPSMQVDGSFLYKLKFISEEAINWFKENCK